MPPTTTWATLACLTCLTAAPLRAQAHPDHGGAAAAAQPARVPYALELPRLAPGAIRRVRIPMTHRKVEIAPGKFYEGWAFGGSVPGPVLHVEQGDSVRAWIVNESEIEHSLDFHSGRMAPSRWYRDIPPGDSLLIAFRAKDPGVYMAHCGSVPVLTHIANGMYFPMVVRPRGLPMAAREFVFTQSEFYTGDEVEGVLEFDDDAALSGSPKYMAFNGTAFQYKDSPIAVERNTPYRMWVMNAGPNRFSAFHIVGTIFDRVVDGDPKGALYNVQTWTVAPGGGAMFELRFAEDGLYPFVTHAFGDASKGALGLFRVGKAPGKMEH